MYVSKSVPSLHPLQKLQVYLPEHRNAARRHPMHLFSGPQVPLLRLFGDSLLQFYFPSPSFKLLAPERLGPFALFLNVRKVYMCFDRLAVPPNS